MDDLLSEFLTETSESLATLDVELVNLEQNPNDPTILSNIFRLVHTIKGTCGFLGLPRLEKLAHAGEDVLGKFRDGELDVNAHAVTLIFNSIDRIKEILSHLEETEEEPDGEDTDLITQLVAMADGDVTPPPAKLDEPVTAAPEPEKSDGSPVESDDGFPVAAELLEEVMAAQAAGAKAASDEDIMAEMEAERAAEAPKAEEKAPEPEAPKAAEPKPAPAPEKKNLPAQIQKKDAVAVENGEKKQKESSVASQSIRVNVDLLENLMTLVSELVLTRNQLMQMVRGNEQDSEFVAPLQRLSHITTDLQEGVMKTRMQPIGNAWAKLPRIVRDLALETGKKIDLQMIGADTELDRQVLELIKDPLTHMVRNSADHGLEGGADRLAAGKPETGTVTLNAYHEGGHIIIEISDDGRGLNIDRIRGKALAHGLTTEADLEGMTDLQIAQFIFRPGFSTAEAVTSVSGRGVGMDVVRTNIEKIGGTVELKTYEGRGTTFIIKIPLTLAIVSALIVASGGERFAIPQISVVELVRVTEKSEFQIEMLNDAPVLRLRDRLLPLVTLRNLLRLGDKPKGYDRATATQEQPVPIPEVAIEGEAPAAEEAPAVKTAPSTDATDKETFIVVSQVGTYTFGIVVDRVFDTEEIVVKPVAPILRNITMFSGNTILGDGSVIMILDPNGIASATGEASAMGDHGKQDQEFEKDFVSSDQTSLLVFRAGGDELKAVPLGLVARLEEIDCTQIEQSYGKPVVQYRGQLMPLVGLNDSYTLREEGRQPVLVFTDRERSMGLVVDEIVDIAEDNLNVELEVNQPGLIGTAVIDGKATDIIDTGFYLTQAFGDWFGSAEKQLAGESGMPRVLLVDDSPFFINLIAPLLSVEGYRVRTAQNPLEALRLREKEEEYEVIVSDIEMPEMSGFDFAEAIRREGIWKDVILVALSSHASEADIERGREVGFDDYVAKFDKDALIQSIKELIAEKRREEAVKPTEETEA